MRKLIICLLLAGECVAQNFTAVTATQIQDAAGNALASGQLCVSGVALNGQPIPYRAGSGGMVISLPACTAVTNGGIHGFQVANSDNTSPANVAYIISVTDNITGQEVLHLGPTQIAGSTWSLDNFTPSLAPLALVQTGPQGPQGLQGIQGPQGIAGTVTASGTSGNFDVPGLLTTEGTLNNASGSNQAATKGYVDLNTIEYISSGLNTFGDSITYGIGASSRATGYAQLIGPDFGGQFNNFGVSGDQAADMAKHVYASTMPGDRNNPVATIMIGTNDANPNNTYAHPDDANKQDIYQKALMASATWLGLRSYAKVFAQSGAVTRTGSWSADNTLVSAVGLASTTNASTLTFPITTHGGPIYLGYRIIDGNLGQFTVAIDGVSQGTLVSYGTGSAAIATQNGATDTVAAVRYPVSAGSHSLVITVTSPTSGGDVVSILWAGTPDAAGISTAVGYPRVLLGGVPKQINDQNATQTGNFNTIASTVATQLNQDGMPVTFVPVRAYMASSSQDMNDYAHPNDTGHIELKLAFEDYGRPSARSTGQGNALFFTNQNPPGSNYGMYNALFRYVSGTLNNFAISSPAAGKLYLNFDQGGPVVLGGGGAGFTSGYFYGAGTPDATSAGVPSFRQVGTNYSISTPGKLYLQFDKGGGTVIGNGAAGNTIQFYASDTVDSTATSWPSWRFIQSLGNVGISAPHALYLQFDYGTSGVVFGDGAGHSVAQVTASGTVQANQGFQTSGSPGLSTTVTIGGCTLTFAGGILTAKSGC